MKECKFQPNVGRVVTKHWKKPKDGEKVEEEDDPNRKKTGKEIATRLYKTPLAARQYKGKTQLEYEYEKN